MQEMSKSLKFEFFNFPPLQAPHRSQEPQDRRVQDDDGSGR